ncbi:MAG: UpxY family transcription antiterminator [Flaviramulus sp.]|nr:UpxY family transcription antiterminator [Flaviramulus sp.]
MSWFVLSVKSSQEKKVADILNKMGIQVFNPLIKEVKYWSDRQKLVESPLFKSYVFVNISEKYRRIVFGVPGVKGYLFLDGKPALVGEDEIAIIQKWINEERYDLVRLSKLISRNEIAIQEWLMKNNSGIKWIGKSNVSVLLDQMHILEKEKLREVI